MSGALVTTRSRRDDPDRANAGSGRMVDVVVIGYREAAPVGSEVMRLLVLPPTRFQLAEIGGEPPGLTVMSPKGFHQTVCGESRRLLARLPYLDQGGGCEANDERGERRAK